jgi:epoxyqueuosine reductase
MITESLLDGLRSALAEEGLHILLPLEAAAFDQAVPRLRLEDLLPGAQGALIVADGGGVFFARFRAAGGVAFGLDPLDRYTAQVVPRAVVRALDGTGVRHAVFFPFARKPPFLPFQRLGQAAGMPAPGPLGLQIHPVYGPWWAYRALVVLSRPVPSAPPLEDSCRGCPAPCAAACPGHAVSPEGFVVEDCTARRISDPACQHSCQARAACIRGPEHRYPGEQVRFHMSASLSQILVHRRAQ